MNVRHAWGAFVIGLICLVIGLFIKTNQLRQEEEMRTLMVPVEVTDTQYLALESISMYDAQQAAQIIANEAVTSKADETIKAFGSDPMPRTESFVNAEVADVEAKVLYDQIAQQKANERRNEESPYGCLTKERGVFIGPSGRETYYNLPMKGIVNIARSMGYSEEEYPYWVREDGAKMLGPYVLCAANLETRPRGTILDTSLGEAIVMDTGGFVKTHPDGLDLATNW